MNIYKVNSFYMPGTREGDKNYLISLVPGIYLSKDMFGNILYIFVSSKFLSRYLSSMFCAGIRELRLSARITASTDRKISRTR